MALIQEVTKSIVVMQRKGSVIVENLQHAGDPDYAKKIVNIKDAGYYLKNGAINSMGVEIESVKDARNEVLDSQIRLKNTELGTYEARTKWANQEDTVLGMKIKTVRDEDSSFAGGISDDIREFFRSFSDYSTSPTEASIKESVLIGAKNLASQLNRIDADYKQLGDDIKVEVNANVSRVNQLLGTIAAANQEIQSLELNSTQKALSLRSSVQSSLEELSEYINYDLSYDDDGKMTLAIKGTDGGSSTSYTLIDAHNVKETIKFDSVNNIFRPASDSDGSKVLTVTGGKVYGAVYELKTSIPTIATRLDNLTKELVQSVNSAYNPDSDTNKDFFNSSNLTAGTIALDTNLDTNSLRATNTSEGGDNNLALAVTRLQEKKFSTGSGDDIDGTFTDYLSGVAIYVGQNVNESTQLHTDISGATGALKEIRRADMNVSLAESGGELVGWQQMMRALTNVLNIVDKNMELVMNAFSR